MRLRISLLHLVTILPFFAQAQNGNAAIMIDSFVRGSKIIFQDDFSSTKNGEFPVGWTTNGSAKVDTTFLCSGKWLKILKGQGITCNLKPILLPDSYTVEFDIIPQKDPSRNGDSGYGFTIISTHKPEDITYGLSRPGDAGIKFDFGEYNYYNTYYDDGALPLKGSTMGNKSLPKQVANHIYKMAFRIEKESITVWRNSERLFNLPDAISLNYHYNMIRFENGTPMIRNIRIASK